MAIYIRHANTDDLEDIMAIINSAKKLLKQDGSPQWQDGTPNETIFSDDIKKHRCYILMVGQQVAGVAVLMTAKDPNYADIKQGDWQEDREQYATIHRIAISPNFRGKHLGEIFFSNLISYGVMENIHNFRIDTHAMNKRMQHLIEKFDFKYRGIIHVDPTKDGARYAYELNL